MKVEIEVPKEFESQFVKDGFKEALERVKADIHLVAGNSEKEIIEMLINGFSKSREAVNVTETISNNWIKTDDLQYVKKVKDGVYKLVEARYAEDKYLVCRDKVVLSNWLDSDGKYDKDCEEIITAYYETVEEFENKHQEINYREQPLAEMIFQETPYYRTDKWEIVSMEQVEERLKDYIKEF